MILQFVKTNILSKKLKNFLTIFAIVISVMLIICIQNISEQLNTNIIENISEYDLIIGKTGSSTGLVINSVFYYGVPEGNIDISYLEKLTNNKYIEKVVPLAMGDNYSGYKIIGTTTKFFENDAFKLAEGSYMEDECEIVLGATVAKKTGLKIGDEFKSQHGLNEASEESGLHHDENFTYKVVGILESTNTPNDTVLFTTIETLWHAHGIGIEDDEILEGTEEKQLTHGNTQSSEETEETSLLTAILVRSKGLSEQNLLYQELKNETGIQVVIPTESLRELLSSLNIGETVVTIIASVSIILSIIMLFITMLTSSIERRKDISILRALGANRKTVFKIIMLEIAIIAIIGVVLGFICAHIFIGVIGNYAVTNYGLNISAWQIQSEEAVTMMITMILSLIAGIIPAVMVYKTDVTKYLK